jgi:hypothetical protein
MTETPSPAISIVYLFTPVNTVFVDCSLGSDGFTSQYFWGANGQYYGTQSINYINGCFGGVGYADGLNRYITPSQYFGWSVGCWLKRSCNASSGGALLGVQGVEFEAQENTGPSLIAVPASNLWYQGGWVRGTWSANLDASDPSGVCGLSTAVNGQLIETWSDPSPDTSSWTQCDGSELAAEIDTTKYPNGRLSVRTGREPANPSRRGRVARDPDPSAFVPWNPSASQITAAWLAAAALTALPDARVEDGRRQAHR